MRFDFTRFTDQFTDDELATVWKWGGMGQLTGDPEAPFPGRDAMNDVLPKFLRPIPRSWRDILRRELRRLSLRRRLAELAALLRQILLRFERTPFVAPAPAVPVVLDSQLQRITSAPTRGSPMRRAGLMPEALME